MARSLGVFQKRGLRCLAVWIYSRRQCLPSSDASSTTSSSRLVTLIIVAFCRRQATGEKSTEGKLLN